MQTKIAQQKAGGQQKERPASTRSDLVRPGIPNSAMLSMMGGDRAYGSSADELGERIRSRLPSVRQRPQAQIPQAEDEADRLSSAVNAGTPETVKAVMGQRMGADFSGVRFHTGADAAARADAMGARAYTSGADVYFGTGGFDPAVAAHELVHTAQQGMVDSGADTMSTPVGGVQMWGRKKKDKKGGSILSGGSGVDEAPADFDQDAWLKSMLQYGADGEIVQGSIQQAPAPALPGQQPMGMMNPQAPAFPNQPFMNAPMMAQQPAAPMPAPMFNQGLGLNQTTAGAARRDSELEGESEPGSGWANDNPFETPMMPALSEEDINLGWEMNPIVHTPEKPQEPFYRDTAVTPAKQSLLSRAKGRAKRLFRRK